LGGSALSSGLSAWADGRSERGRIIQEGPGMRTPLTQVDHTGILPGHSPEARAALAGHISMDAHDTFEMLRDAQREP